MATESTVPASIGTEMHNTIDWMDIFDNAEVLIGAEHSGVEVFAGPTASVNPTQQLCKDSSPPIPSSNSQSEDDSSSATTQASTSVTDPPRTSISNEDKKQARSERKRSREKQRRLDVNAQIVELTTVLQKVEAEENDGEESSFPNNPSSPGNRVDLIGRTIATLSRFYNENGKRQREITELQEKVTIAKKKIKLKEVQNLAVAAQQTSAMMMPMMNGNFMPMQSMQSMMYPTACVANPMQQMYNAMVQPKMHVDLSKPQSILQPPPTFLPASSYQAVIQKTTLQPTMEKGMTANLAHCA